MAWSRHWGPLPAILGSRVLLLSGRGGGGIAIAEEARNQVGMGSA